MEETPKLRTKEEIAQLEKTRTISDAELLKGGAEYIINENGEKQLVVTERGARDVGSEHNISNVKKFLAESYKRGRVHIKFRGDRANIASEYAYSVKDDGSNFNEAVEIVVPPMQSLEVPYIVVKFKSGRKEHVRMEDIGSIENA